MGTEYYTNPSLSLTFEDLLDRWESGATRSLLRKAFGLMLNIAETEQVPGYAQMVLETARILLDEMNMGLDSVLCCILKNVTDKRMLSPDAIGQEFGQQVRSLMEGIQKLERLDTSKYNTNKENFIGLLATLSDDIRVLLIRLAMRLYDMRHLSDYSDEKQGIIVGETMALYIPIAHRLGLYRIKNELEDSAMRFVNPLIHEQITRKLLETKANRDQYTAGFIKPIAKRLAEQGFDCEIKSRVKSIPSIYRKMKLQKVEFEKIYDIFAIRIILNKSIENDAADCWKIYSLVTDIYSPNPYRLRDWISSPKSNGYESLHTTVIGHEGLWVEIQIRTRGMDEVAEKGYASHWKYKSDAKESTSTDLFMELRNLLEQPAGICKSNSITQEKKTLYTDDIFVFTPEGDLKKLRRGCSVLDFAYETQSEKGSNCTGAIVNGKIVPLKYTLVNGDTVKILSSKTQKPNWGWLEIVKCPWNLTRVKQALKMESLKEPESGIQADAIPGKSSFPESISRIKAGKEDYVIIDPGIKSLHYQFARCCDPAPGDSIFAFVSVTQGIKIHRTSCANSHQLITRYPYRILEAKWK
jgi:GTP pyrophosphokinase